MIRLMESIFTKERNILDGTLIANECVEEYSRKKRKVEL